MNIFELCVAVRLASKHHTLKTKKLFELLFFDRN